MAIKFNTEADFEAAIADRVATSVAQALEDQKAAYEAKLASAKKITGDARWNAFAGFPDLLGAIKATALRPTSLPAACLLEVWKGASSASAIAKIVPKVPGPRGKESNAFVIGRALATAEAELLLANKGVGIAVTAKKGSKDAPGDSLVRVMKFQPWTESVVEAATEQQMAA